MISGLTRKLVSLFVRKLLFFIFYCIVLHPYFALLLPTNGALMVHRVSIIQGLKFVDPMGDGQLKGASICDDHKRVNGSTGENTQ